MNIKTRLLKLEAALPVQLREPVVIFSMRRMLSLLATLAAM